MLSNIDMIGSLMSPDTSDIDVAIFNQSKRSPICYQKETTLQFNI